MRNGTIIVPIDFSDSAQTSIEVAADLARELGAGIRLLHVIDSDGASAADSDTLADDAWGRLQNCAKTRKLAGIEVTTQVAFRGSAERIAAVAEDLGAELIVLGTATSSEVTKRLMALARCPVVTVQPCAAQ